MDLRRAKCLREIARAAISETDTERGTTHCLTKDDTTVAELSMRMSEAPAAYAEVKQLCRRPHISLKLRYRVCCATVRRALLYGWRLCTEDFSHLEVFDHQCLRSIVTNGWNDRVSNEQ